ncbi:hypothetical protein DFH29DRAFT_999701 [Suillus ampliporus]|nr:hypothetical protein DFH29DRAFT_999701 [Suillus ampliporus]
MDDGKPCSSSEEEPLVSRKPSRPHQSLNSYSCTALIALVTAGIGIAIFASVVSLSPCNNPLDSDVRNRLNLFWTDPKPHMCTTYSTREFTARLINVPYFYNRRVEACMATAIQIHGVEYTPKWCEDHGPNNVVGHWKVDQQPDCVSYWTWYKDLGCVSPGSGQRRIEQYLKNIPLGGDWREFCATTPTSLNGVHFIGAQSCLLDPNNDGTWGYWDIDDKRCK